MSLKLINPQNEIALAGIGLWGYFKMQVYDHSGGVKRRILKWEKKNQITNQGRDIVLLLMCPYNVPGTLPDDVQIEHRIWSLSAGTNGTPPTISDDDATMVPVWTSAFDFDAECIVVSTPPNSFYLQITKTMPTTEGVGSTLTEAGVFTRGDDPDPALAVGRKLYSRQVHTPIVKTITMTIEYSWQLGISIQS